MNIDSIINDFYISRIIYILVFLLISKGVTNNLNKKKIYLKDRFNNNINMNFLFNMIFLSLFIRIIIELPLPKILIQETSIFIPKNIIQVIIEFITTCIFAPILEEIIFRFGLFEILNKKMNYIISILITSLLFAFVHLYGLDGMIVITVISIIWNYSYIKTNNLIYPILIHCIHNIYALTYNILDNQIYCYIVLLISFIGFIFTLKKQKNNFLFKNKNL